VSLVSVIIPVYNAGRFLDTAIKSILAQSFSDFELIAVNDGSTDQSASIIESYANCDSRVKLISRGNTGIVRALEDGRAAATGEFIARMDADDWAAPSRFEAQLEVLRADSSLVALGSSVTFIDADGNAVERCARACDPQAIRAAILNGDGGALIHPAVMFRASAVNAVGGYRPAAQHVEDLDLYLRLDQIGLLSNVPQPLLHYRIHGKSINFTKNRGRHDRMLSVLQEAYAARGLRFDRGRFPDHSEQFTDLQRLHRTWAVTALDLGPRRVAIWHGCRAVLLAPSDRAAWKALCYAVTANRSASQGRN
jgi:glycosyltransferase involved in cell wall biosynthesis